MGNKNEIRTLRKKKLRITYREIDKKTGINYCIVKEGGTVVEKYEILPRKYDHN